MSEASDAGKGRHDCGSLGGLFWSDFVMEFLVKHLVVWVLEYYLSLLPHAQPHEVDAQGGVKGWAVLRSDSFVLSRVHKTKIPCTQWRGGLGGLAATPDGVSEPNRLAIVHKGLSPS